MGVGEMERGRGGGWWEDRGRGGGEGEKGGRRVWGKGWEGTGHKATE
jgi:hypothetical protein